MLSERYFLNPSVHWCFVHRFCVALDVEQNRYISLPADAVKPLLEHAQRMSIDVGAVHVAELPAELAPALPDLIDAGILTTTERPSFCGMTYPVPPPARLVPQYPRKFPRSGLHLLLPRFLRACVAADYRLRHHSLARILSCPAVRHAATTAPASAATTNLATQLASAFITLRPFYPRRYRCIFDSLALLEFLRPWHVPSRWVFGVSIDPFQAHCWVQHEDLVLCDTRDFSAVRFNPIMIA